MINISVFITLIMTSLVQQLGLQSISKGVALNTKSLYQQCVLVIIADGFNETTTIAILCALRKAGICAKSVGLTSGLINGAHGILVMSDFTLADLERSGDPATVNTVVLLGGEPNLSSLEADPRVHRLLRQVVAQQGFIVIDSHGAKIVTMALGNGVGSDSKMNDRIVSYYTPGQPVEQFAQDLVRRLERVSRP